MQSRKTKARHGRPKNRAGSPRVRKRARSPRQVLAVGLTVGGLTTSLFGVAAGAQSAEPTTTESAAPAAPDAAAAPAATPDAETPTPPDDGVEDPQPPDADAEPDPDAPIDPPPTTDPVPEAPAPAAPEAPAPATAEDPAPADQDAAAPATPEPAAPKAIPAFRPGPKREAEKASHRPRHEDTAGTGGRPHRHTRHADGQPAKQGPLKPGGAQASREPTATPSAAPAAPVVSALAASSPFAPLAPLSVAVPGASIDNFRVPLFLLPIYEAAGSKYGVSWNLLAAINEIETDYGRNVNVSSAGAVGWMQFMPSTWDRYGVDANRDGIKDPYNPVDAIFAAARYLRAAGAQSDLRGAVLAYNHADWYADDVLARAQMIGSLPGNMVDALSALAQGRLPVRGAGAEVRAADAGSGGMRFDTRAGAAVVAVNDGTIAALGHSRRLGRFVRLRDGAGNTYTYGRLASVGTGRHKRLRRGARVAGGSLVGHVGAHLLFEIRPAGHGTPRIDPEPILDGWRLLETAGLGRVHGAGSARSRLVMSQAALAGRVLTDPSVQIYGCGRDDIRAGAIDRRVLATLEFLSASGFAPTVSSLRCGHSLMTSSGNVSEHSTGTAVDIAAINGIPIAGHQGPGSITETVVRRLLTLQGEMKPHQIITLMQFPGTDNTFAMADHADHIHVGWRALSGASTGGGSQVSASLRPKQWTRLVRRIERIKSPRLSALPSRYARTVDRGD
jgi:Transglycosylase SLT domain/Peptidase family M23